MRQQINAYPLTWPDGWARTRADWRERSRFGTWKKPISVAAATDFVLNQLRMMNVWEEDVIISSNIELRLDGLPRSGRRAPEDRGVAVWWRTDENERRVIAIDKYDRCSCNLWAIGKTLEALRGVDRWGGGEILERTFTGFTALPDLSDGINWRDVLGYAGNEIAEAKGLYLKARSAAHPDKGGSEAQLHAVSQAWIQCCSELS